MNAQLERAIERRDELRGRIEDTQAAIEELQEELKELQEEFDEIDTDIFHYENSSYEDRKYECD